MSPHTCSLPWGKALHTTSHSWSLSKPYPCFTSICNLCILSLSLFLFCSLIDSDILPHESLTDVLMKFFHFQERVQVKLPQTRGQSPSQLSPARSWNCFLVTRRWITSLGFSNSARHSIDSNRGDPAAPNLNSWRPWKRNYHAGKRWRNWHCLPWFQQNIPLCYSLYQCLLLKLRACSVSGKFLDWV